jgi:TonB family protein
VAEEKNIANYTAADIEKYWKGKLSPAEMHAMEKAAMDDPFFADALEGYQYANTADDDLKLLDEKIDTRTNAAVAKVIPIATKQKKYNWLRVAAAIIIIGGAGVLVQQLFFDQKNNIPIVDVKKQEEKRPEVATNKNSATPDTSKKLIEKIDLTKSNLQTNSTIVTAPNSNLSFIDTTKQFDIETIADTKKTLDDNLLKSSPSIAKQESIKSANKENEVREKEVVRDFIGDSLIADKRSGSEYKAKKPETEGVASGNMRDRNDAFFLGNKYNFKVVDAQNNPVPFANVMNTRDNVGTYTDIRGNFNLVSSDSVMDVQIRSQGYLSNNYRLMPTTQTGALVLKEDEVARRMITQQSGRVLVTSVTRKDSTEIEEPEDGWGNYNTYVQNNIQIPETIRSRKTSSDVELSFDIDKNGQPINIKVTKSSQCKECDEEAKRLLKEGPKWKKKGKKSKTTISIAIDQ